MAPGIGAFGLGVAVQIKNLNVPLPHCLALKNFVDRHGFAPHRATVMQL